jgi:RHS repeat-associated protein
VSARIRRATALRLTALAAAAALLTTPAAAQVVEYYHLDAIGNVRAVSNQAGDIIERHEYLPFGEEWCAGPPAGPCSSLPPGQPRRFTGKERDVESGLDYFGARYYESTIGRFTTVDPVHTWQKNLVDPQRWNRYAYARNNPLRYVDPDGRQVAEMTLQAARDTWTGPHPATKVVGGVFFLLGGMAWIVENSNPQHMRYAMGTGGPMTMLDYNVQTGVYQSESVADPSRQLPETAGPTGLISPSEVIGKTPAEIDARARELGLQPMGPDPAGGRGSYIDPKTGEQRILVHPAPKTGGPHGHVNDPSGQRVGPNGERVPPESKEAHLPIKEQP